MTSATSKPQFVPTWSNTEIPENKLRTERKPAAEHPTSFIAIGDIGHSTDGFDPVLRPSPGIDSSDQENADDDAVARDAMHVGVDGSTIDHSSACRERPLYHFPPDA